MAKKSIDTDAIIDAAVSSVLEHMNTESITIQTSIYKEIKYELDCIKQYFVSSNSVVNKAMKARAFGSAYGFNQSEIAYEIVAEKKEQALVYRSLNRILAQLRHGQEMKYALYIKDLQGRAHRYEVPESELASFTEKVQGNNPFSSIESARKDLRDYAESTLEILESNLELSKHIDSFLGVVSGLDINVKLADAYEGFEYHYQKFDGAGDFAKHGFNAEGIRRWFLGRGHDTVGWWARGDIGLTSVKSINLNNKYLFLSLTSKNSLNQVYNLMSSLFSSQTLGPQHLSRLTKAFTPVVDDLKHGMSVDVESIIQDLINSLTRT